MAHNVTSINNMGSSTLSGSTITNTGMKDNDHMHISEDFVTGPGVKDFDAGEGKVTQSATLGKKVKVAKGRFYILNRNWTPNQNSQTRFWRVVVDADEDGGSNLTISPNTTLATRIDLVCIRVNPSANPGDDGENSSSFFVVKGTVNATVPSIPNDGNSYEILARLDLPQNYTDVLNAYITDLRVKATILGDDWRVIEKSNDPNFVGTNLAVVQYVSSTQIKISGDWRNVIGVNYRLKFTNGGSIKYFITTDSGTFAGGYTTYTVSGGGLYTLSNSSILCAYYSNVVQPLGFPTNFQRTLENVIISNGSKLEGDAGPNFTFYGMSRQAIINGNFDVWQRGTSLTVTTNHFLADRWQRVTVQSGTPPTIVHSRQVMTSGDIPNAFYFYRQNFNGAGSGFGAGDVDFLRQKIEHGVRHLAGLNRKITVSFWAKSNISNKKIALFVEQNYGSGGAPSGPEIIVGTNWTLTSSWTKYTHTFTLNTLAGKTFGGNNDDSLGIALVVMWGTGTYAGYVGSAGVAETYKGAGNVDIAQVQVCSGDVALPFQPKSFGEELVLCQRYAEAGTVAFQTDIINGTNYGVPVQFKTSKRVTPTVTTYNIGSSGFAASSYPIFITETSFMSQRTALTTTGGAYFQENFFADAEL